MGCGLLCTLSLTVRRDIYCTKLLIALFVGRVVHASHMQKPYREENISKTGETHNKSCFYFFSVTVTLNDR